VDRSCVNPKVCMNPGLSPSLQMFSISWRAKLRSWLS